MIRASECYNICTDIPVFDEQEYLSAENALIKKVGESYSIDKIDLYVEERGLITIAKNFKKQLEKKEKYEKDELPDGVKSYLEKLWLTREMGLFPTSNVATENLFALKKGIISEEEAINLLSRVHGRKYSKNSERVIKGFITGECDIKHEDSIRDVKCPASWESFRDKIEAELVYRWQTVGYCYLYSKKDGYVDYVLMPTPEILMEEALKYSSEGVRYAYFKTMEAISKLPEEKRVKSFHISEEEVGEKMIILESRLDKSEQYYNTLTYEKCIKLL